MNRYLRPGYIIAFIIVTLLVYYVWGLFFAPGGLAANVLLGLVVAGMIISYGTRNWGAFLEDWLFNGGSWERASLMKRARADLKLFKQKLKKISKRKRAANESGLQAVERSLNHLEKHILDSKPNLKSVEQTLKELDQSVKDFFRKMPHKGLLGGFESLAMALLVAVAFRILLVEPYQIPSGSMIPTLLVGDHLFVSKLSYGIMNPISWQPSYLIRWASPKPGDVMIFEAPDYVPSNARATWIKRVIAVAGQKISIKNSVVYVDGKPYLHLGKENLVHYYDYNMSYGAWRQEISWASQEEIPSGIKHEIYMRDLEESWPKSLNDKQDSEDWPKPLQSDLKGLTCDEESCLVQEGYVFVMGDNRGGSLDSRWWGGLPVENIKGKALFIWMSVNGKDQMFQFGRFAMPEFRWSRWFQIIR